MSVDVDVNNAITFNCAWYSTAVNNTVDLSGNVSGNTLESLKAGHLTT